MVSRPGKPGGGVSESFSDTAWGAAITRQSCDQSKSHVIPTVISGKAIYYVHVVPESFLVVTGTQHRSDL